MPELVFKGKEFVYNHHLSVPFRPLEPDPDKSIGDVRLDGNLVIHGDNLHALKALLPMYAGKVDCIFIDPPYNTGHEGWCYNDNVNSPVIQEWLNNNPVGIEDGLRHDKWCAMMYPRLRLLYELLSERGSLWMTLDDNEMRRAHLILDDIFGESNFLGTVIWEKGDSPRMDADFFSTRHDYLLSYAKEKENVIFNRLGSEDENPPSHYNQEDENGNKYYLKPLRAMGGQGETREARPNLYYELKAPDGTSVYPKLQNGTDGAWRWSQSKYQKELWRIEWRHGENSWVPYFRIYADTSTGRPPETIFANNEVGSSRTAKAQIKQVFNGSAEFDTPKPLGLVERVLEIATELDSIVLDSFSGSGTTAHAVLSRNNQDGGTRKFILVECEDYANDLTAERVRRVINGYTFQGIHREVLLQESLTWTKIRGAAQLLQRVESIETAEKHRFDAIKKTVKNGELHVVGEKDVSETVEGLGGHFTYCTLGEPIDFDRMLTGESLPSFEALGAALFHTATNRPFDASHMEANPLDLDGIGYLGESESNHVWLIYKPDLDFLKSRDAALTLAKAEAIAAKAPDGRNLVFAPARFVSQKMLNEASIPVEFAPLPFALYRIERGSQS